MILIYHLKNPLGTTFNKRNLFILSQLELNHPLTPVTGKLDFPQWGIISYRVVAYLGPAAVYFDVCFPDIYPSSLYHLPTLLSSK